MSSSSRRRGGGGMEMNSKLHMDRQPTVTRINGLFVCLLLYVTLLRENNSRLGEHKRRFAITNQLLSLILIAKERI